ncbi:peptidoglycan-binding protein [Streptomyces scopuliridis]|uniref:Peptidoglycan-binding protein n=1 Tax=Streptomyces scopuliridis TaxID=452529 RepID=A0ACD4ZNN0_9ACTN|nr:peptidoglycan-binding protein [Streptomyces scopuliridis]WSB99925.1 peptidoglycan-binding protein [Streptomyces scopuliridis]WSC06376.1 peptidoglycan-binding protein [Streptomyces scopuliridis]
MTVPAFEEYEPAPDCPCAGCAEHRRDLARGLPVRAGGHPAAHGARRALVLMTAAGVALGATGAGADTASAAAPSGTATGTSVDPNPGTPQGGSGPLHGRPLPGPGASKPPGELRATTRADIINRAKRWVQAQVPYSMEKYWSDGYRQDCSGYVSMAWNLSDNEWTGSLADFGVRISRDELEPGDMLLFHNPADPNKGSHVTLFGGWTDYTHSYYVAYEQTKPHARMESTPVGYWSNPDRYVAYRYKGLTEVSEGKGPNSATGKGAGTSAAYPGARSFGPGARNAHVTRLGRLLIQRGGKRFYSQGPGPQWGEADRRATRAFQLAQGWRGAEADGTPGPGTWRLLVKGLGKNIPAGGAGGRPGGSVGPGGSGSVGGGNGSGTGKAAAFPGVRFFRPGQSSVHVEQLGRQLVRKGFGKHYTSGPGRLWTEADRRNVEAFQRAQGWRGSAANGYPGPETWRRLFA